MGKGVQELAKKQRGVEPWALKSGLMEKEGRKEGHAGDHWGSKNSSGESNWMGELEGREGGFNVILQRNSS